MECYFLSRPVDEEDKPVREYRRKMHNIWKERYHTEITKQRLCDQAGMIRKNEWITKLELENITSKVLQKEKDIEVNNNDNTGERFYQDEENRCVLAEWSRKINCILKHIRTENITDTNILIKAVILYVGKKIGIKVCGSKNKKESEPR